MSEREKNTAKSWGVALTPLPIQTMTTPYFEFVSNAIGRYSLSHSQRCILVIIMGHIWVGFCKTGKMSKT